MVYLLGVLRCERCLKLSSHELYVYLKFRVKQLKGLLTLNTVSSRAVYLGRLQLEEHIVLLH